MFDSDRHGKGLPVHLLGQRLFFVESLLVAQRGVADASELVGQRAGGLVVVAAPLHIQSPSANASDLVPLGLRGRGGAQHTSGAVGQQHAQIAIPALGDVAQVARVARAVFLGREAKPAGEVACVLEVAHIAGGRRNHRGGRQQANARNGQQRGARRAQASRLGQLALQLGDARFQQANLLDQQASCCADQVGHGGVRIGQHPGDDLDAGASSHGDGDAELTAKAAQGVDARSARAHPQAADAVQPLQGLLLDRFDAHRANVGCAGGFQQGSGIGRIGLVASHIGAHVLGRQQLDFDAQASEPARPVVGRAARLHDDQADIAIGKPALELGARQALGFDHAPGRIGHGQLEDGLCQIDGNGCSIHVGLLSFEDLIPTPMKTSAPMWRKKRGESIPSVNTDAQGRPRASRAPPVVAGYLYVIRARTVNAAVILAIVGTLCGVYYWYLGISVGAHFVDESRRKSPAERFLLGGLGWSIGAGEEFTDEGRKMCRRGNIVFVLGVLCWFGWGALR